MNPAPAETAEILHRVRQQLILAQVRIMELEDSRDEKAAALEDIEKLLGSAQALTDRQLEEASHLEKIRRDLQAQYEHMRHMQHVTNEALIATREQLASTEQERDQSQAEARALVEQTVALNDRITRLGVELDESKNTASLRLDQINQLSLELAALKNTRSWRWTAWLRRIASPSGHRKA
jgi:chromosome segregation ATPase